MSTRQLTIREIEDRLAKSAIEAWAARRIADRPDATSADRRADERAWARFMSYRGHAHRRGVLSST